MNSKPKVRRQREAVEVPVRHNLRDLVSRYQLSMLFGFSDRQRLAEHGLNRNAVRYRGCQTLPL
jgi:hypothetical protein